MNCADWFDLEGDNMDDSAVNRMLKELGYDERMDEDKYEHFRWAGVKGFLQDTNVNSLSDMDESTLEMLYNEVFSCEIFSCEIKSLPTWGWGPYDIPKEVLIEALMKHEPIDDIEKYRIPGLTDDDLF